MRNLSLDGAPPAIYENDSQLQRMGLADARRQMKMTFDMVGGAGASEPAERSCYRRSRGGDPIATIASLALVALGGAVFLTMSPVFVQKEKRATTVVELLSLPEDPPPAEPQPELDTPPPPPTQLVTPPPQIVLPPVPTAPAVTQVEVARPTPPAPQAAPAPPAPALAGPANGGDLSAQVVFRKPIRVPLESRRQHEEGVVVLSLLLGTDGRVAEISVANSSGFPRLDRAAMDAVRDWRWSPLMRNGSPVMVRGLVRIPFIRDNGPDGRGQRGDRRGRGDDDRGSREPTGSDRT